MAMLLGKNGEERVAHAEALVPFLTWLASPSASLDGGNPINGESGEEARKRRAVYEWWGRWRASSPRDCGRHARSITKKKQ